MKDPSAVVRYANWVVRHPWIVILITLLLVMAAASGGRLLVFNTDYRVFFSDDNPQMLAFEAVEAQYSKNDNVMFMLVPKDGNVFNQQTLEVVKILSEEAWQLPYSTRVDSLSNFQHTEANGDELIVRHLIDDETDLGDVTQRRKIRDIALAEPILLNRLVSQRGHVTGVNVTVQLPGENSTEVLQVAAFARDLATRIETQYPDIEIRLNGMVFMNNAFSEASQQDMKGLIPLSFGLMMLILGLMTRSVSGTLSTLLVIISSIIVGMGLGGYIGFPITPPSASSPIIILTIAIANCVHIIVTMLHEMRTGLDKKSAIVESLRINMQPVFIASITTTLGFLSMNFSDVPPFQHLGNMVAMGVVASFILAISLLPAVMSLLPVRVREIQNDETHLMHRFSDFVVRQRHKLVWGMTLTVLVLIAAIPRNELNDVFVHYFDQSIEFRQDADFMAENLTGLYVIDYSLSSGQPGNISDPQFLQEVEAFANWFRAQPETIHVNSITDIMRRLNKNMHGDDPRWFRLPQERELAAQYLLLYEMSLPYGLDLNNQINVDKSAIRFTASLKTLSSNELLALERRASGWLAVNAPHIINPGGSSTSLMFAHIGERNIISMLTGTTLALIGISLILIFALRSLKIGLISMLPNLVPAAMGFGLWGLLVGEIGLGLSIVAGMTLGIVVDDTVHLLSKYLRARREKNLDGEGAVRYAFRDAGMALLTTSMVLVCGFLVLALSSFQLNANMGLLTAIVITFALLADFLLLLPLLLMQYEKKQPATALAKELHHA
ncbi:Predicted exporter of the RND superfamily [hydrothermal vent metagenome]|uniref:Predicted exporter of the RND superfamily n=1 Tax=hydrothermal vent metagenome TaxID=652676 RepID=A0A3B0ZN02_9ZZZZ